MSKVKGSFYVHGEIYDRDAEITVLDFNTTIVVWVEGKYPLPTIRLQLTHEQTEELVSRLRRPLDTY